MLLNITIGSSPEIISQAQSIRHSVFVVEQNIPQHLDLDGLDERSNHVLVTDQDILVATARFTADNVGGAVIARVAVLKEYRGLGVATNVVSALMSHAREIGIRSIEIHAHTYLRDFYQSFGFEFVKEVEIVGEHQLIEMRCQLSKP